jgi:hypothetical protein
MKFFVSLIFILGIPLLGFCQFSIDFDVKVNKTIGSRSETYIQFQIRNKSKNALLIPSIPSYNSIYFKSPNIDLGYELYSFQNGKYILQDSCYILPVIPNEGITVEKYTGNSIFRYDMSLPVDCFNSNKKFKIRFTFFANFEDGPKKKFVSDWYFFEVTKQLL